MTNPVVFKSYATATIGAGALIQQQQIDILQQPLTNFNVGDIPLNNNVVALLPNGPLRNTAALLAGQSDVVLSYRMVAGANGELMPQYSFREATPVVELSNVPRAANGGPNGGPAPTNVNSLVVNVGGTSILIGANVLMNRAHVPAPFVGPVLGTSWAAADLFTGMPEAPMNQFMRNGLTSMGVATPVQYGFAYGFDAAGVRMGTFGNTAGSIGGTTLFFLPAVSSPLNPVYSPAFANAFRSAIGVGLTGTAGSSTVFLASGGPAGGAGLAGGSMQALGVAGAVLIGSSLGGKITEMATGMDDESDDYGQLARMARDRMYSDAWGSLGRSPLGHLMAGLTVACGYGDEFAEGMGYAEQSIVRDVTGWTDQMDPVLASLIMASAPAEQNQPMGADALEQGVRNFYQNNSETMNNSYRVVGLLRRTHKLGSDEGGITRFVNSSGEITDRAGFNTYAATLAQRELNRRTTQLTYLYRQNGLTVTDGRVTPVTGSTFSDDQVAFLRGDGVRLSYEIVRLTNALETLRPAPAN